MAFSRVSAWTISAAPLNLRFDLRRGGADGVDALYALAQQVVEDGVVAAFVFAAENQVDVRRETIPAP